MKKIIIGMILLGLAGVASAEMLVGYDFDDGTTNFTTAVTYTHADISATDYTGAGTTPGLNSIAATFPTDNLDAEGNVFGTATPLGFGGKGHPFGYKVGSTTYAATLADSFSNNVYMTFSVTPENGETFDLESFTFKHLRGKVADRSADQWALYSSIGGLTMGNEIATGTNLLSITWNNNVVTLGDEFNNVSTTTEFRLYIYGATSATANKDDSSFDKVVINGTVISELVGLNLTNNGDDQWTTVGNWVTNGTTDLYGSLPTGIDNVWVTGAMELSGASVTGTANDVTMNPDAVFTITNNATLDARAVLGGINSDVYNYGTVNLSLDVSMNSTGSEMFNYGAITATGDLKFNKGGDFHMLGGTFTGDEILTGDAVGVSDLNVHGGTMTFNDMNLFDTNGAFYGSYGMDFEEGGTLILNAGAEFANLTNEISVAMAAGYITTDGVADSGATMTVDGTTITLTAADILQPVDLDLANIVDNQWTNAGNYTLHGTNTLHGALPTGIDDVWVTGAMELSGSSVTGEAQNVTMNQDAVFTITSNATLNARAIVGGKTADTYNYGTVNLSLDVSVNATGCEMFNYGDITAAGDLKFNKGGDFHMLGGTFTGDDILTGTKGGGTVLNLHGGTMTFSDINIFDTNGPFYGSYTMDVQSNGTLIIEGQDLETYFQDAISSNLLTGAQVTYNGTDTIVTSSGGGNPTNPIGDITMGGLVDGDLVFSWDTSDGQTYNVETNANLMFPSGWGIQDTIIGDGSPVSVTNSPVLDKLFYKVTTP